jgi:hypothetical protein
VKLGFMKANAAGHRSHSSNGRRMVCSGVATVTEVGLERSSLGSRCAGCVVRKDGGVRRLANAVRRGYRVPDRRAMETIASWPLAPS